MNAFVRNVARRTSIGLGVLALAVGAAACGGDDAQEPAPEQEPGVEETAPEDDEQLEPSDGSEQQSDADGEADGDSEASDGGESNGDPEASDGGGDAEELSEQDLEAAKQSWVGFIQALDDQDAEQACSYLLHPETGQTGEGDPECEAAFEEDVMSQVDGDEFADLDTAMIDAEDNGDGTVTVLLDGQPFPLPLVAGEDGEWYLTGPTY